MRHLATVAAFGFEAFDPPEILAAYRRLGCRTCQVLRNEKRCPDARQIIDTVGEAGLTIDSIHGWFGPQLDPSHPDPAERARAVDTYRRDGEYAASLGGPRVVVHPGGPAGDGYEPTPSDRAQRLDPLRRSIDELTRIGESLGVTFLWENLPNDAWIGNDPLQIAELLREVDAPWARMCFDTGHANMTGPVAPRLAGCADTVDYFHIHDNAGDVDDHRMPGDGTIDWAELRRVVHDADIDAPMMLELFHSLEQLEAAAEAGLENRLTDWLAVPTG